MKVIVVKEFRDKKTKDLHEINKTLEVSKERFSELTAGPLGVFVREIKEPAKDKEPAKKSAKSR